MAKNDNIGYITKIMILQVTQQIFCEILISGKIIGNSDMVFEVTNIRTNVQNNSSEFKGLLHEMTKKNL